MNRRRWRLIAGSALIGALLAVWFRSTLGRAEGVARLVPGAGGGLNELLLTGPYGWDCIEYAKTIGFSGELEVTMSGRADCRLFGPTQTLSTDYPATNQEVAVPLEQHVRVYQSEDQRFELYVLITKDPTAFVRLRQ